MRAKQIFRTTVLDKNANEVGKVSDLEFDDETGKISTLTVSLRKNILENGNEIEIKYDDIATIGQYIILSIEFDAADEE